MASATFCFVKPFFWYSAILWVNLLHWMSIYLIPCLFIYSTQLNQIVLKYHMYLHTAGFKPCTPIILYRSLSSAYARVLTKRFIFLGPFEKMGPSFTSFSIFLGGIKSLLLRFGFTRRLVLLSLIVVTQVMKVDFNPRNLKEFRCRGVSVRLCVLNVSAYVCTWRCRTRIFRLLTSNHFQSFSLYLYNRFKLVAKAHNWPSVSLG